jgi:hypothetical protein
MNVLYIKLLLSKQILGSLITYKKGKYGSLLICLPLVMISYLRSVYLPTYPVVHVYNKNKT